MSGRNSRIVRNRERSSKQIGSASRIKIIVSSLIFLLVCVIVIGFIIHKNQKKEKIVYTTYGDTVYEYFLLYSEDKVGVIDKKGNKIIETKYSEIYIPNPEKDVFVCYVDDTKYEILNQEAQNLFTDFEYVEVLETENESSGVERDIFKYREEEKYGIVGIDGTILTEAVYDEISSLKDKPGAILVKKNDKYGILDIAGNEIIEPEYDLISSDGYCSEENLYEKTGYIVSQKKEDGMNFGYIDNQGNKLLETKYESLERAFEYEQDDIYLIAMQKGKKGVFQNKKKIIDLNFQEITYSDLSNVFVVNKNGKYGFYNSQGKVILKPEYSQYSIAGNYISVQKEGETKLFDINGNLVDTNSYTKMIETPNPSYFIAEDDEGFFSIISKDVKIDEKYTQVEYAFEHYFIFMDKVGKAGMVDAMTGEVKIDPQYDFIILINGTNALQAIDGTNNFVDIYNQDLEKSFTMEDAIVTELSGGYAMVYSETDMKYIDKDGKVVENTEVYPDKKIYATQKNDKWGFVDTSDKVIVECEYDIVTEFNQYGFAGIKKDGKWGVVNEEGKIVVEPTYEIDTYYFPEFVGKYRLVKAESIYCEVPSET